ncbi:MAG: ATP-binding protein, partial [Thermoanaerobaculia bacterium]
KMKIETQQVELAPVVTEAVETILSAAEAKRVTLTTSLAPGLCVRSDARRLQQVVWNLLSNAVKVTPADGRVTIELRQEDREAVIEVRDTGAGIDPAFMPYLFERFRQADSSSTRAHMGLGLGLAIVRHLVELHGGAISAESRGPGHGATFRVRLPLLDAPDRAPELERYVEPASALQGVRVLIVDDDEEVRHYVETVFRKGGAEVATAPSARDALKALETFPADVVLSDLGMPIADGFDLLHWIRESKFERVRNVPVVALTAFAMPEDRQRVLDGGFQGFVAKPVEPAVLRRAVLRVTSQTNSSPSPSAHRSPAR